MPTKLGKPRSFHKKFKFTVDVDGFDVSAWTKCSELSAELAKIEQWEGGSIIARKEPGRLTFTDLTLERGATSDESCFTWFKDTANAAANSGDVDDEYKRDADINTLDRDNKTLRKWRITQGWPVKFNAGDWDNTADENVMESLTLTYDFFDKAT